MECNLFWYLLTILKIDFDQNKELIQRYQVKGYPTLVFLKDGVEIDRLQGLQQKPVILRKLEELLK